MASLGAMITFLVVSYSVNPIDRVDSGTYTCRVTISSPLYSASVRGCNVQSQTGGPTPTSSRSFTINDLEEDSIVSVIITAVNNRGSTPAVITTSTTIAGMLIY